jgi:regulator of cell morphogenesis and NO signaling
MTQLDRSATVAQIVSDHAVAARVFQRLQIDFCCHGDVTVTEACEGRPLDPDAVFAELEAALPPSGEAALETDPRALPIPALIAHIIEHHHAYLRRALPYIAPLADKVAGVHGPHNEKLPALRNTFLELADALEPHLDDEEQELFPALMSRSPDPAIVKRGLDRMYEEHVEVGALLARLRSLADGYTTPEWGCSSYRVLMSELEALEGDVLRHVHLENHVLMPRFVTARGVEC